MKVDDEPFYMDTTLNQLSGQFIFKLSGVL